MKWSEHAVPRHGGLETVPRMTRVFGTPGDGNTTTETIDFHAE